MGFGPNYISWVCLLHSAPLARVKVNGTLSKPFLLERGTRYGCPSSPMLYALALEPLAYWVRKDSLVRGLCWDMPGDEHILLYGDKIMLYIADSGRQLIVCSKY